MAVDPMMLGVLAAEAMEQMEQLYGALDDLVLVDAIIVYEVRQDHGDGRASCVTTTKCTSDRPVVATGLLTTGLESWLQHDDEDAEAGD